MGSEPHDRVLVTMARLTAGLTFLLVLAGGLVTSRDAGLAVPDWPLSFGSLNPPGWYAIENVRTEHGHRLIAGCVALCTLALAWLVQRREARAWVRRLALAALATVLAQAALGGLRVLELSVDLAVVHGALGQGFFVLTVLLAAVTSPAWRTLEEAKIEDPGLSRACMLLTALLIIQLVLGLDLRHLVAHSGRPLLEAGAFYAHLAGGLAAALASLWVLVVALRSSDETGPAASLLRRPAAALAVLVMVQIGLGLATFVVTGRMQADRQPTALEGWLPTLHVGVGALLLANACLLWARARAVRTGSAPASQRAWVTS